MWYLTVLFWVAVVATFFLVINQLMYQEHSVIHEWYKQSAGFQVLWIMLVLWAIVVAVGVLIYGHWRYSVGVSFLAVTWLIYFLGYNRVIEMDVQNKITAGDLPPSHVEYKDGLNDIDQGTPYRKPAA